MMYSPTCFLLLITLVIPYTYSDSTNGELHHVERYDGTVLGPYFKEDIRVHDSIQSIDTLPQSELQVGEEGKLKPENEGGSIATSKSNDEVEKNSVGVVEQSTKSTSIDPKSVKPTIPSVKPTVPSVKPETITPVKPETITPVNRETTPPVKPTIPPVKTDTIPPVTVETTTFLIPEAVPLIDTSSSSPDTCTDLCTQAITSSFNITVSPNSTYLRQGESVLLQCEVIAPGVSGLSSSIVKEVTLNWLFEATRPPVRECSLTESLSPTSCPPSPNTAVVEESTPTKLTSTISIEGLTLNQTGIYSCQAMVYCCTNTSPIVQRQSHDIVVWEQDYTTELIALSCIATALTVAVVAMQLLKRRSEANTKQHFARVKHVPMVTVTNEKVIHIVTEGTDIYSSKDSFSSDN